MKPVDADTLRAFDDPDHAHCSAATRNACKLCTPLGACLAFKGIEGCLPFLHGSQGCATYIRRYLIGHFREPMDIAASNFSEDAAVFGGERNLKLGLANVAVQYDPAVIGVATTCLSETIGEDMPSLLHACRNHLSDLPPVVPVSTPSYSGSHVEGFHAAVQAIIAGLAGPGLAGTAVNVLPGMVSPEDIRWLREILAAFGIEATILPDYSDTLDGGSWADYERIPPGGTPLDAIRRSGAARATIELGATLEARSNTAAAFLEKHHHVPRVALPLPIGIRASDALLAVLERLSGRGTPPSLAAERERLVDSMIDAHKVVFGKRAVIFGDPDMVVGLAAMTSETGLRPVLCATGTRTGGFAETLRRHAPDLPDDTIILDGTDFATLGERVSGLDPDLLIGNSKGYKLARKLDIPLIRAGFPIHDRMGGQRILHFGHRGAQRLFDTIANAMLERRQDESEPGFTYF